MEIAKNVHQLSMSMPDNPLGYVNVYLFVSSEGCLLVDTGWNTDEAFASLRQQLLDLKVSFGDLKYVVVTHAHPDHYGLAKRLREAGAGQLVVHEIEYRALHGRMTDPGSVAQGLMRWLAVNGVPGNELVEMERRSREILTVYAVMPDRSVVGGERVRSGDFDFEVIWTPGHTPGHICLHEHSRRLLITGDHVLPKTTTGIGKHHESIVNPLADYLRSVRELASLSVDLVLPAHGSIFHDLQKRLGEIEEHHRQRKNHMANAVDGQQKTAYEVTRMVPWDTMGASWAKLPPIHQLNAVAETIAHLELLRSEGILDRTVTDGIAVWHRSQTAL